MNEEQNRLARPNNDKLPYDVLVRVFDNYAECDGMEEPLEKLLSICRTWSTAACEYKSLWSSFRVRMFNIKAARFWSSRVPKRIERCGSESFLDLHIQTTQFSRHKDIDKEVAEFHDNLVSNIFSSLTGQDCCLIHRWRRLRIFTIRKDYAFWSDVLSRPTPNLISLGIFFRHLDKPILPSAPRLEELEIDGCSFTLCQDLPSLKTLKLAGDPELRGFDTTLSGRKLATLELLNTDDVIPLPPVLPALEHIVLRGYSHLGTLERLSAPRLRALSYYSASLKLDMLKQASWIALPRLEFLGLLGDDLRWHSGDPTEVLSAAMKLREVIQKAENVKHFYIKAHEALRILLICFEEGLHYETRVRGCKVELDMGVSITSESSRATFEVRAETIVTDIRFIREFINVPANETLDSFLGNILPRPSS